MGRHDVRLDVADEVIVFHHQQSVRPAVILQTAAVFNQFRRYLREGTGGDYDQQLPRFVDRRHFDARE